jgi:hypothetical protein
LGTIAAIIASPFFGASLIAYGVAHLLFVGEPTRALRNPSWTYLGWAIFGICLTAIIVTVGWGAANAYIESQIARGIQTQQVPDRQLSNNEVTKLLNVFKPIANIFPNNIQVESVSSSPDAAGYAQQFMLIFHKAGLTVNGISPTDKKVFAAFPDTAQVASSRMRGLFLGIQSGISLNALPERALKFQAALRKAGFNAPLTGWQGVGPDDFVFVVSYR